MQLRTFFQNQNATLKYYILCFKVGGQISSEGADPPGEERNKNFLKMSETTDNGSFGSSSLSTKNWMGPSVVLEIVEVYSLTEIFNSAKRLPVHN